MKRVFICLIIAAIVGLTIAVCSFFIYDNLTPGYKMNKGLLNMSNTVNPIISKIAQELCDYENIQFSIGGEDKPAKGGALIYKREPVKSCISGIGNVYYIRCYEWNWEDDELWYTPIRDVPIGCYSCIDENDVIIPYWDEQLQNAEIGVKYRR